MIIENDFTVEGQLLRIEIAGKECDGFTYSVGFSAQKENDFKVKLANYPEAFEILLDPFAAFYTTGSTVDFIQDFEQDLEGFVVINPNQEKFHGKFWRNDGSITPPLRD